MTDLRPPTRTRVGSRSSISDDPAKPSPGSVESKVAPVREAALDLLAVAPLAVRARDAARLLGVSPATFRRLRPYLASVAVKLGDTTLYPVDSLRALLAARSRSGALPQPEAGTEAVLEDLAKLGA